MPIYLWSGNHRNGESKKGETDAISEEQLRDKLRREGITLIKAQPKTFLAHLLSPRRKKVDNKELMIFTKQLSTMINAGLPLVQCLSLLGQQSSHPELKRILLDMKFSLESGQTFSDALRKHPHVFNKLYVNLAAAGEASGILDAILVRLANYIEKEQKLNKKIKKALTYPLIVFGVSMVVTLILLIFVIPVFEKMFQDFGNKLPEITQFVVDLSQACRDYFPYIFGSIGFAYFGITKFIKTAAGKEKLDTWSLKIPVFGPMLQKFAVAKITRTLGTMLSSGVNIMEAMEIVSGVAGNVVIERSLILARIKVGEGKPLAQPLSEMKIFPNMVVEMIAVGEATGALDTMLNKIADFYDDEVDNAVDGMTAVLEPLVMCFLAVLLGGLVISMYLPVFSMAGGIST